MKLSAPTKGIWLVAMVFGILGIISHFVTIPVITINQFWFVAVGFVLLALGSSFKGI